MRIALWLLLAALGTSLNFTSPVFAQAGSAPSQPGAETVRDFSKGFEKFAALGLPDIKKATWVELEWSAGLQSSVYFGHAGPKLKGNAWLFETKPGGRGIFVTADGRTMEVGDLKQRERNARTGQWSPADLSADVKTLLGFLEKPVGGKHSDRYYFDSGGWGQLFLYAVYFHQKGLTAEANQIAARLFQQAGDSRKVIQQAVNLVADSQYQNAFDAFKTSADWAQFGKEMEALLARIPNWRNRPVFQRLADAVKKRIATPEPPAVEGADLTDEDRKLARELGGMKPSDVGEYPMWMHSSSNWVLGERSGMRGEADEKSAVCRIMARKAKAFPLLIALLKDDYLVAADLRGNFPYAGSFFSSRGEEVVDEEKIQEFYDAMSRPATRGEIARELLKPVVLDSRDRYRSEVDTDTIRQQALDWYGRYKDKTDGELARHFLEQGSPGNRHAAIEALAQSSKPEDQQAVEKHFLESKDVVQEVSMVSLYVMQRGEAARGFVDKYLARIKANPDLLQPVTSANHRMSDNTKKIMQQQAQRALAALEQLVSSKSAEAIIEESLNAKQKWTEAAWARNNTTLARKLAEVEPQKRLGMLLNAAVKAQDIFLVQKYLELVTMSPYIQAYQARYTSGVSRAKMEEIMRSSKPNFSMAAHAEAWRKLLADTRSITDFGGMTMGEPMTVGQYAGIAAEQLFAPGAEDRQEENEEAQQFGSKAYEVYRTRAEARLAGKPESALPKFPSGKNVSAERRKTIQTELTTASGESLRQRVAALTSDEYLALHEILAADAQLNTKLAALANVISDVQVALDAPGLKQQAEALKGKPLDRKMVETLVETSKALLKEGKPIQILVSRAGSLGGIKIRAEKPGSMANVFGQAPGMSGLNKALLVAYLHTSGSDHAINGYGTWLVDLPANLVSAAKKSNKSDDGDKLDKLDKLDQSGIEAFAAQETTLWKSLETVCAPKFNACESLTIMLIGSIPSANPNDEDAVPYGPPMMFE